jgi:hypothetical protein
MMKTFALFLLVLAVLAMPVASATGNHCAPSAAGHYVPQQGDSFGYYETTILNGGSGNYSGYLQNTYTNGSETITGSLANGTVSASYQYLSTWSNNQGGSGSSPSHGTYTFSSATFLYLQGTDNETGYTDPYVWFYMNNLLTQGATFTDLNTPMSVVSTDYSYQIANSPGKYVKTIFSEGNGTFQRNDQYGVFSASYNWKSYFDPSTGYIVGYLYTEQDIDGANDGFVITDTLSVTTTTYTLTPDTAPPQTTTSPSSSSDLLLIVIVAVVVIVIVVVLIIVAIRLSRRSRKLPRHAQPMNYSPIPPTGAPPPVGFNTAGQPPVQQIVIRETVKVNCKYCNALIDTTDAVCPKCGAPRT